MLYTAQQIIEDFQNIEKADFFTNLKEEEKVIFLNERFNSSYSDFIETLSQSETFNIDEEDIVERLGMFIEQHAIPTMDKEPEVGVNIYFLKIGSDKYEHQKTLSIADGYPPTHEIMASVEMTIDVDLVMLTDHEYQFGIFENPDNQTMTSCN
jgi:hypothetical protein